MTDPNHPRTPDEDEVVAAAQRLGEQKDEEALELQLGMRADAVEKNPELADEVDLQLKYDTATMGPLDEIKRLGARILNRWNRELYALACPESGEDTEERRRLVQSLNLGETAVIGAVAGVLLSLGVGAAIAAPLAPLLVKRFIWPARNELCDAWGEAIEAQA